MNQSELIAKCAEKCGLTKTKMKEVLETIGDVVLAAVKAKHTVTMPVLGRFVPREIQERSCRNPRTGQIMKVPGRPKMAFSASSFVKESLQKK